MNMTPDRKGKRLLNGAAYAALFLAGVVQGMLGSFQYSRDAPLGALAFCAVLLVTCVFGAWGMRSVSGAVWPALGWVLASFVLSMPNSGGSVIIASTAAGKWYLYGGTVAALAGVAIPFGTRIRRAGARPL